MKRFVGWLAVAGLAALSVWTAEAPEVEVRESPVQRLFGPPHCEAGFPNKLHKLTT